MRTILRIPLVKQEVGTQEGHEVFRREGIAIQVGPFVAMIIFPALATPTRVQMLL